MSDEKFSEEEMESQKMFLKLFDEMWQDQERYWKEEYPKKSRDEKIKEWLAGIHTGMRYQGESTGDAYSQFSPQWYKEVKSREPDFDDIFKEVGKRLESFDWDEYRRRIIG